MTEEMWLIAACRLLGALPVLRWPFVGGLIALAVDQSDLFMMNLINLGGVNDYQTFDKYLDQAYLLAFLVVALRWDGPARNVAVGLYLYRLAGVAIFEATGDRDVLLLFPNFFEYWFLLIAALKHFERDPFARRPAPEDLEQTESRRSSGGVPVGVLPSAASPARVAVAPEASWAFGSIVALLVALKLFQEYALHYGRWLDGFTAVEAVETIWRVLTPPF